MRRLLLSALLLSLAASPAFAQQAPAAAAAPAGELPAAREGTVSFSADPKTPNFDAIAAALKDRVDAATKAGFPPVIRVANVDLNGDGQQEILARLEDGNAGSFYCGAAGCETYVYGLLGGKWEILMNVASQSVVIRPDSKTNGYLDISLEARADEFVRWRFDGRSYVKG